MVLLISNTLISTTCNQTYRFGYLMYPNLSKYYKTRYPSPRISLNKVGLRNTSKDYLLSNTI